MSNLIESRSDHHADAEIEAVESPAAETQRIIRTGTIWLAAALLVPAVGLGPMLASGWRPTDLPVWDATIFWLGIVAGATGTASLIWAGCPTLGFPLLQAHKQKQYCIRAGIVLFTSGAALVGFSLLVSPAVG